jgi:prepilin-type N-terminal cleavage/methylation domain-containing protein
MRAVASGCDGVTVRSPTEREVLERLVDVIGGASVSGGPRGARRRGFSLLELIVVMAVIAALAAIVTPRMARAVASRRSALAAERIAGELSRAAATARTTSREWRVEFAPADDVMIVSGLDARGTSVSEEIDFGDEPYIADVMSTTLGADHSIIFNGDATPDRTGTIRLQAGGEKHQVLVDASGRITIVRE